MAVLELAMARVLALMLFAAFAQVVLTVAVMGSGLGALVASLRPARGARGRAAAAVAFGVLGWGAVALVARVPWTRPGAVEDYAQRTIVAWDLVDFGVMAWALPMLAIPYAVAGWVVSSALMDGTATGPRVAADRFGFGLAAAFAGLWVAVIPPPDQGALTCALAGVAAALWSRTALSWAALGAGGVGVSAAAAGVGLTLSGLAGVPDEHVVWTRWTPLARLALHEGPERTIVMLDNTSASEVVRTQATLDRLARDAPARSLVYELGPPPGPTAILAAGAGPEVAVAQVWGVRDIEAIDLADGIGAMLAERYPHDALNPWRVPGVRAVVGDGRRAVAGGRYGAIQLVHANLHSASGLLAAAWSPALLTTREGFGELLDALAPDGVLSVASGPLTMRLGPSLAAALAARGCDPVEACVAGIGGTQPTLLARPRAWTEAEGVALRRAVGRHHGHKIEWGGPDLVVGTRWLGAAVATDDRPFVDPPATVMAAALEGLRGLGPGTPLPAYALGWRAWWVATGAVGLGALVAFAVASKRGPRDRRGAWAASSIGAVAAGQAVVFGVRFVGYGATLGLVGLGFFGVAWLSRRPRV